MAVDGRSTVLLPTEAEAYAQTLQSYKIKDIGNPSWMRQHEYLEKFNMQALLNASNEEDEFVKDFLISAEKIPVLIHELLAIEVWKQKVFSIIMKMDFEPKTTFPLYMALYHEATLINLVETIFFYRESCEAAEDSVLDLVDYCYRKITALVAKQEAGEVDELVKKAASRVVETGGNLQELGQQEKAISFDVGVKAVAVLRYVTDHLSSLPLSVATRLLNTHDVPVLLVQLVESPPWTCMNEGKLMKNIDGKWQEVPMAERLKLTKLEGQVWIAIFNLLMGSECQQKYEFNQFNKDQVLKLRGHMTEVLLDQIPMLVELQRYLEHLSMMEPPSARQNLVLEQVPEIYDNLVKENEGKWAAIAKHQVKKYFDPPKAALKEQAKRFADTYNFDLLEGLINEPPKCGVCGQPATKRCSRCQNEWYCRRECQVKHWPKHKAACKLMTDALDKIKLQEGGDQTKQSSS
ncbi:zinc finger MYND domain-containing protein 10-like [Ptychodera flava]|uniref:zinc finger MYND domain-containing protein 10-like n=1 Tax=Ptychodera flava TaxID=63121 RepID=UPI003969F7FD